MPRYVAPFLIMLAVTGQIMRRPALLVGRDGEDLYAGGEPGTRRAAGRATLGAVPGSSLVRYIAACGDTVGIPSDARVSQPARWRNSATTCS
jgi:hypothetical protein